MIETLSDLLNFTNSFVTWTQYIKIQEMYSPRECGRLWRISQRNLEAVGTGKLAILASTSSVQWSEIEYFFQYHSCVQPSRQSFDISFLFRPRWVLISVFFSKFGQGIFLGISYWLKKKNPKAEILFVFHLFFVMTAYEVILSSDVTVPPPEAKIETLAELFEKYKVLKTPNGGESRFVKAIINRTGFTLESIESHMVAYSGRPQELLNRTIAILNGCNTTMLTTADSSSKFKLNPHRKRHFLSTDVKTGEMLYFEGISSTELAVLSRRMYESGILELWKGHLSFVNSIRLVRKNVAEALKDSKPTAFSALHWRLSPVFLFFVILITATCTAAVAEGIFSYVKNWISWVKKFK